MYKIFVINLPDDRERRSSIEPLLEASGVPYEIVDAVNGALLEDSRPFVRSSDRESRAVTAPERGCTLSHRKVLSKIIDQNLDYALVLEDDIDWNDEFLDVARIIMQEEQQENPSLTLLSPIRYYCRNNIPSAVPDPYIKVMPAANYWFSHAYVINRSGAQYILARLPGMGNYLQDSWPYIQRISKIDIYAIVPALLFQKSINSGIEAARGRAAAKFPARKITCWERWFNSLKKRILYTRSPDDDFYKRFIKMRHLQKKNALDRI